MKDSLMHQQSPSSRARTIGWPRTRSGCRGLQASPEGWGEEIAPVGATWAGSGDRGRGGTHTVQDLDRAPAADTPSLKAVR